MPGATARTAAVAQRREAALGRLLELSLLMHEDMTQSLARDGLTTSRASVLWELRQRGPTVQRTLAEALGVSARTVTGLVDGLVATGFVTREPHPTDRRASLVTFTSRGRDIVAAMEHDQVEFLRILFDGMPAQQFDGLVSGVDEIVARLRAHGLSYATNEES